MYRWIKAALLGPLAPFGSGLFFVASASGGAALLAADGPEGALGLLALEGRGVVGAAAG